MGFIKLTEANNVFDRLEKFPKIISPPHIIGLFALVDNWPLIFSRQFIINHYFLFMEDGATGCIYNYIILFTKYNSIFQSTRLISDKGIAALQSKKHKRYI